MRTLNIDINNKKGKLNRYFSKCIGAGRAGEVMKYTAFEQLKQVKKDCGFEYIRFHGLFHEEMAIVSRNDEGKLEFNFQYVDLLFDSLLSIGLKPIVELGLMPDIMADDRKYVFWWKMNICPPKDIKEWYQLVFETVNHFKIRYGEDEVAKWYFEVWNEPNHPGFFSRSDDVNEYLRIYEQAAYAVKNVSDKFLVGGPASAGLEFIDEIMDFSDEKNVPLDFVTSHQYCVEGAFDADGTAQTAILPIEHLTDSVNEWGQKVKKKGYPFIITEWSASYSPRDTIHDSYYSAPFILETVKRCEGNVDMMSYWVYTDIFEETSPPKTPFHGGFGMLTVQSVKKPSYHAFEFLNNLSDAELNCDDKSAYATKSDMGVQIVMWNNVRPELKNTANRTFFRNDFPAKQIENAKVVLYGFEKKKEYKISIKTVGYKMGDCYDAYLHGGFEPNMSVEQVEILKKASEPKLTVYSVTSDENGCVSFEIGQTENQADFINIEF